MTKILFLIHDLGQGGAEKVLVNLVNNMDPRKFDITVTALFGGGVNELFLKPHIRYRVIYPKAFHGNSHVMKLLTPKQLHNLYIKEHYDIEVAYLEGPPSRIISGCTDPATKTVVWIHCTMNSQKALCSSFRSFREAIACYSRFDQGVFVSSGVMDAFLRFCPLDRAQVVYNTNESDLILKKAAEPAELPDSAFLWCGMGKLVEIKGYDRMLRIQKRLVEEGYDAHFLALGEGPKRAELEAYVRDNGIQEHVTFLGYQTNPYKYLSKCDLFVCASHSEGFSTAATESLIVGTPVCTVEVSGMKEMLGDSEYGLITENSEEALYQGIKKLLDDPDKLAHYNRHAQMRGKTFSTENTVKAAQEMLLQLCERI